MTGRANALPVILFWVAIYLLMVKGVYFLVSLPSKS
jgi:hypothetical protein